MLRLPLKVEGMKFVTQNSNNSCPRWCRLRYAISLLSGKFHAPRGVAIVNNNIVTTCYMRWHPRGRFVHNHGIFIDPWLDPDNGKVHTHVLIEPYIDPWTKEGPADFPNCWCGWKRAA